MRRITLIFSPLLLLLAVACQRPEVEAFKQHPRPVVVACQAPSDAPDRADLERDYAAALRARLATRVVVVPEGAPAPEDAVTLRLEIQRVGPPRHRSSAASIGWGVGVTTGALSFATGHRDWIWDGFFWGLWSSNVAAQQESMQAHLGYAPREVDLLVRLTELKNPEPLAVFSVDTGDVIAALSSLREGSSSDPDRVREEEAKAFARVVVARLTERFEWKAGPARYYGVKAQEKAPDRPVEAVPVPVEPEPPVEGEAQPEAPKEEAPKPETPKK